MITKSSEETNKLGFNFVKKLKSGDLILLYGELGAGKTTFVQGLASGLGIKDRILSPTFVLQRSHMVNLNGIEKLNHIDLYRIETPSEINSLGLSEIIEEENSITLIEWADRISDLKTSKDLSSGMHGYQIWFKYLLENQREIKIIDL